MTRKHLQLLLLAIYGLSIYFRVVALRAPDALHPDEIYQYMEPAYSRLTGTGLIAWEYADGVRSWVLPTFNGALMVMSRVVGVPGAFWQMVVRSVWAALSLILVFSCFRASKAIARILIRATNRPIPGHVSELGWEAGLMGAALCACFPWIVQLSAHTLSELPATISIVSGLTLCIELSFSELQTRRRLAFWASALVAAGVLFRITYAPCAVVFALTILCSRHRGLIIPCALGASIPMLIFGVVDWVTWGAPFISYIRYFKVNALEGVAASFGVEPPDYYWEVIRNRLSISFWPLAILCVVGLRGGWLFTLTAVVTVGTLSLQPHKEERFIVLFWPLFLSAAAGTAGAIVALLPTVKGRLGARFAMAAATVVTLVAAHRNGEIGDFYNMGDRMVAQTWLGKRKDVSGILIDDEGCSGGQGWFGQPLPWLPFQRSLLKNQLFSHAILTASSPEEKAAKEAGFTVLRRRGPLVILGRSSAPPAR